MGIIPHMYRKGHCVVVEGLARPGAKNVRHNGPWKFFISATEVLDQPHHPTTAFQRNKTILTVKKIYSQDSEIVLAASYRYSLARKVNRIFSLLMSVAILFVTLICFDLGTQI